ncbi:MAG: NAD-dependent epimerase/dehydratase family protein [Bacteroidia bacterium]|nr:NAD-dependent epimerase/dehydratase family protein [Bacteroidia bacterium]
MQKFNVIITGSTGMVGKSVLLECIDHPSIKKVLLINRSSLNFDHSKVNEILLSDFSQMHTLQDQLKGFDACFHCMGISSIGKSEEEFTKITFDLTKILADTLYQLNNDMVFNYVSGTLTDSSEKGKTMWARVKGKTENYILNKGFKDAYMFRPGGIVPEKWIRSSTGWYTIIYVLLRPFFPWMKKNKNMTTTTRFGQAMINSMKFPSELKHLENEDINLLANMLQD